ncbi:MAG: NAD(P)-dependent oxidoreductase [Caldilineaceae bacterium]
MQANRGATIMILVTGATGMTGHFVVQELQKRNYPVRVLVRESSVAKAPSGVDIAIGDLADSASLQRACKEITGIIHTACTFTDSRVDIAAMQTLLDQWRDGPFIFISSLDVYGFAQFVPMTEAHPLNDAYSDYAKGKIICERMLAEKAKMLGRCDYAMLRAPYIWGPHPKAYAMVVKPELRTGQPFLLPGANETEWSQYQDVWTDVRDLAWVIAEAFERPPGGPLNVLTGHFIWHDLYAEVIRLMQSKSSLVQKALVEMTADEQKRLQIYAQTWRFSNEQLLHQLDFQPRYNLEETLAALVTHNQVT